MGSRKKLHPLPEGEAHVVEVERVDNGYRVSCEAPRFDAEVAGGEHGLWSVVSGTGSYETRVTHDNGEIRVLVASERFSFGLGAAAAAGDRTKRASARAEVKAPMPGKVVKVLIAPGEPVSSGQGVVLFEAMKMQNEIKSPQDGIVVEIAVNEGQAVEARDRLFVVHSSPA